MKLDKINSIRNNIASVLESEAGQHELDQIVSALVPRLHDAIQLPGKAPQQALQQFVVRYVRNVPEFLQTLQQLFTEAGLEADGQTFLNIATDYFTQPPDGARPANSLYGLIDAAYLAHRLIEEINDRLLMLCGRPLTRMDMTLSNIVVHDILGDNFANQLDLAVHYAVEVLFDPAKVSQHTALLKSLARQDSRWQAFEDQWPCLAGESAIRFDFKYGINSRAEVH